MDYEKIVGILRENSRGGEIKNISYRISLLKKLKQNIKMCEEEILTALKADYNKCGFDGYTTEIAMVYEEINTFIKHLKGWARPKKVSLTLKTFPSKGRIYFESYGAVLIISPWNYPFQLAISPLVGAVGSGNCVVLKPASATENTSVIIEKIVKMTFSEREVVIYKGNREQADKLTDIKFDFIFFTGSAKAGRIISAKAARNLTPLCLELGGKSPCIIDENANIDLAARRIAWGKFLNAGQTCVAPDYLLVQKSVKEEFIKKFVENIKAMYYEKDMLCKEFPYLINQNKLLEINELLEGQSVIFGGNAIGRQLEPTIVDNVSFNDKLMAVEIFAPVAPIIEFEKLDEVIQTLNKLNKPLALYYFGKSGDSVIERCSFGGGCINDTIMHVAEGRLPFGGVGESGLGSYHGHKSFECFSHSKSVMIKGKTDIKLRYSPHNDKNYNMIKKIMK